MERKFGLDQNILDALNAIFARYAPIEQVLVYGSRATKEYKDHSDIDLAVGGIKITQQIFAKIWNEINDLPIVFKVDVVHLETLSNHALKEEIIKHGKILYQKPAGFSD